MVQKTTSPLAVPAGKADAWPAEVAGILGEVRELLDAGRPAEALERISRSEPGSPWLGNAAAVCRLRLGDARAAVDMLRGLVVTGGLFLRDDVPAVLKVNFAAALIADGNLSGGLRTLGEVGDKTHPAVAEVRDAVRRWEAGMTFWQRLWWSVGGQPPRPLVLHPPPGWLE
jgi:hypothetical protein